MTQLTEAKSGKITPEIEQVARDEEIDAGELRELIASGRVVLPKNKSRDFKPMGIGKNLRTKVNANIGSSPARSDSLEEVKKLKAALEAGTDSVMDLSTGENIDRQRRTILEESDVMVGTVPIYQVMAEQTGTSDPFCDIPPGTFLDVIEKQAEDGVDYITVHCGVTRKTLEVLKNIDRTGGVVSRGGSFLVHWMRWNEKENPLFEYYDDILDIAFKHDVTLSLGDGLRPGAIDDSGDAPQIDELVTMSSLAVRARERGVQVMIEGPGHVPLGEIKSSVEVQKSVCDEAPFYVLGPIPTDIAPGYDHITAAIGGAISASAGADFLCYVTPAEHLKLPDAGDVKEGVMAARIAAHIGDIAKGVKGAGEWDRKMSEKRSELDWEGMFETAIDSEKARKLHQEKQSGGEDGVCSMCGHHCSIKKREKKA